VKLQVNKWDLVTCAYRGIGLRITLGLSNDPTGRFFAAQDYKVLGL
jgi:hypothetical protein